MQYFSSLPRSLFALVAILSEKHSSLLITLYVYYVLVALSQHRLNIPDTGSGIGSSFSRSLPLLDWMTASKPVGHTKEKVSTANTFDIRTLSVEIASCSIASKYCDGIIALLQSLPCV